MKYSVKNPPLECMMTQSTCYKNTGKMTIKGVLWHSTGANNTSIKRYVQPDDNAPNKEELRKIIGVNLYRNDWNHISYQAGLNAWIGKLANGTVGTVQTMPWNFRPWGCGSGSKGSCNYGWIQCEICEDSLNDKTYASQVYEEACQLTAFLCRIYNLDPNGTVVYNGVKVPVILCHADSYKLGLGSNHGDVLHWFPKFGFTMDTARKRITELLNEDSSSTPKPITSDFKPGDLVALKSNAIYWGGATIPETIKSQKWYVYAVSTTSPKIIINENEAKTMSIMSPINSKYVEHAKPTALPEYKVRITANSLNYRAGPGTNYAVNGTISKGGVYTIVEEAKDKNGGLWGKLKSGAGWISLQYTEKI